MLHQCTIPGFELWIAAMNLFFFSVAGDPTSQGHRSRFDECDGEVRPRKGKKCRVPHMATSRRAGSFFFIMMVQGFCVGHEGVRNKTSAKMWCWAVPSPLGIGMSNTIQRNMENILSRKPKCRKDNSQVHTCKNQPWTIITSRSQAIQCSCGVIAGHSPPLPNFFC
jgi:hypothetical protein